MVCLLLTMAGCSTQKNTATTRWWHAFNARYNTYFNGAQAYIDGSLEKENGNRDNFTELIPLYPVGNKTSREIGKSHFDRAIEKSKKAIQRHSIKRRPEWKKTRKKTEKDIAWLSRREYNPFLWKAWMLMGRAQFHQGHFDEAAATFSYMSRLYQGQPAIYGKARAWLAKCYVEQDWLYDAEDVIRNYQRDSMDWRAEKEWNLTLADYYIHIADYAQAIPYMHKVIKQEMRKKQKAREYFLLGQLYARLGRREEAYKAYQGTIRQNPPYELEFNARIAMTEVMSHQNEKQMIARLKRMAVSDNNKEYLDQVYYAIGNIYLNQGDTANAITAYEKGVEKGTRSGIEKGVLLLKLGDIYWLQNKFSDARRCYNAAIGMLDKDRPDYEQLSKRSVILDELVPYTEAIHLQDSLQQLAAMSEDDRNAAIDRVIDALKKKEREERRAQQEADATKTQQQNAGLDNDSSTPTLTPVTSRQDGSWYFYNPMAVAQGKTTFQQQWGKRENIDNWQRINRTVVGGFNNEDEEYTPEQLDSIRRAEAINDSINNVKDSVQNDPHRREYYLAQIPFTPEQMETSDVIIMQSLYQAGVIFKDKLNHLSLSLQHLDRLESQYGSRYDKMDDVYYHLFLLYSRMDQHDRAQNYIDLLKTHYPESQWTTLLSDPYFRTNSLFGVQIEDSLYTATYNAFKQNRYSEVLANARMAHERFPLGANQDKFLFLSGMTKLNNGDINGCKEDLNDVVSQYPSSSVSTMAGMILNGINAGRRVYGGQFALDDVWNRRTQVLQIEADSTQQRTLSPERNTQFAFMLVYDADSLNENQLLFEVAKFNFTSYMVRNFDITIEQYPEHSRMRLNGFRNFDEAHLYATQLHANANMHKLLRKTKPVIISEDNLQLLNSTVTLDEYEKYYTKHFSPVKITNLYLLTEPTELGDEKSIEDMVPGKVNQENEEPDENENFDERTTVIEEENTIIEEENSGIVTPTEANKTENPVVIEEKKKEEKEEEEGIYTIEEPQPQTNEPVNNNTVIIEENRITPQVQSKEPVNNNTVILEEQPATQQPKSNEPAKEAATEKDTPKTATPKSPVTTQTPTVNKLPELNINPWDETIVWEEEEEGKVNNTKKENNKKPAQQKKENKEEEFEVIFTEKKKTTAPATKKKTTTPPPIENELEDEYYELEGF